VNRAAQEPNFPPQKVQSNCCHGYTITILYPHAHSQFLISGNNVGICLTSHTLHRERKGLAMLQPSSCGLQDCEYEATYTPSGWSYNHPAPRQFSTQIRLSLLWINMEGLHTFSDLLHLFVTLHPSSPYSLLWPQSGSDILPLIRVTTNFNQHTAHSRKLLCGVLLLDLNDTDIVLFSVHGTRVVDTCGEIWSSLQRVGTLPCAI